MNARQRRAEIHRRQPHIELVSARVEPPAITQPHQTWFRGGRFSQTSTSVFGTPWIVSSVLKWRAEHEAGLIGRSAPE